MHNNYSFSKIEEGGADGDNTVVANLTSVIDQGQVEFESKLLKIKEYVDQEIQRLVEKHLKYED